MAFAAQLRTHLPREVARRRLPVLRRSVPPVVGLLPMTKKCANASPTYQYRRTHRDPLAIAARVGRLTPGAGQDRGSPEPPVLGILSMTAVKAPMTAPIASPISSPFLVWRRWWPTSTRVIEVRGNSNTRPRSASARTRLSGPIFTRLPTVMPENAGEAAVTRRRWPGPNAPEPVATTCAETPLGAATNIAIIATTTVDLLSHPA